MSSLSKTLGLKTSKTINYSPEKKTLIKEETIKEIEVEERKKKTKIKRYISEKLDLAKLKLKKQSTLGLPLLREAQTSRIIKYKKYSPFTTIYAEINRSKREINSYIKEGRQFVYSNERKRKKTEVNLYFSPQTTHTEKFRNNMLLTQSTFFQTPETRKKKIYLFLQMN